MSDAKARGEQFPSDERGGLVVRQFRQGSSGRGRDT